MSLPVADYARARAFYDACLGALGYGRVREAVEAADDVWCGYAAEGAPEPVFCVQTAVAGGASVGTPPGQHVAFAAPNRAAVDAFHAAALAAGGRDNGAPGLRPQYHAGYYAAFVLDPDGHRIEAVFHGAGQDVAGQASSVDQPAGG